MSLSPWSHNPDFNCLGTGRGFGEEPGANGIHISWISSITYSRVLRRMEYGKPG